MGNAIRRLAILVAVAATAYYGWHHWNDLHQKPRDEAVIVNDSGKALERFRLVVGDQAIVKDEIPAGATVTLPFVVTRDAPLGLKWQFERTDWDQTWSAGQVTAGPIPTRHHITIQSDGGVIWTPEKMAAPPAR